MVKTDATAAFKCVYEGDGGKRRNKEAKELEPYPDTKCASDVPEKLADLRKYSEPNFDAMLVNQQGIDKKGNHAKTRTSGVQGCAALT